MFKQTVACPKALLSRVAMTMLSPLQVTLQLQHLSSEILKQIYKALTIRVSWSLRANRKHHRFAEAISQTCRFALGIFVFYKLLIKIWGHRVFHSPVQDISTRFLEDPNGMCQEMKVGASSFLKHPKCSSNIFFPEHEDPTQNTSPI